MKNFRNLECMIIFSAAIFLCAGCVSAAEKAGRVLDGSAFQEKRIARYRAEKKKGSEINIEIEIIKNRGGEQSVIIILKDFPMMKIRGSMPDENAEFNLITLEYLAGSEHGWNEYTLDLSGTGSLLFNDDAFFFINEDIEPLQISSGRIRRYNTFLTGSYALSALCSRRERILLIVEWMNSIEDAPSGQTIKEFRKYWKPLLFQNEQILVQNPSLLRDWEEALSWIYLEYEFENIKETLSRQIILKRKK